MAKAEIVERRVVVTLTLNNEELDYVFRAIGHYDDLTKGDYECFLAIRDALEFWD